MQEMNQGEEYNEAGFEDEEVSYEEEGEQASKSGIRTIYGIPKAKFLIGLAIAGVVILLIFLVLTKKSKSSDDEVVYPEENVQEEVTDYVEEDYTSVISCYDSSGNFLGNCDSVTDGFSIYDNSGGIVGYIDSAGDLVAYDESGSVLCNYVSESSSSTSDYSESYSGASTEDTELLRKMGYTGDEIEIALSSGASVDELVEAAQKLRDQEAKEALARMADSASDEFKYIINNSVFCLPEITFDNFDNSIETSRNYTGSYVVNADYAKVPTYGNQLFIKVKIANNTYAFYCVTPDRWETLPETGNIVMQVNYKMYGTNTINMYITSMSEIDSTHITVNPEDSASELTDIISESSSQYQDDSEENENSEEDGDSGTEWW